MKTSALQLAAATAAPDGPEHRRFTKLLAQIDAARQRLADWQRALPEFAAAHEERVAPIHRRMAQARRDWAFELEGLLLGGRWSRAEKGTLRRMVSELALSCLDDAPDDAELRALHDRHAEVDLATAEQQHMTAMKQAVEGMSGIDLGEETFDSPEALLERARAQMAEQWEAQAQAEAQAAPTPGRRTRGGRARQARPSAAQQRAEQDAQAASQATRDVFRKLAAALHPDRAEPGATPEQKARRHEQMARANAAYEAGDLLALLSLQLEIEQVDVARAAKIAAEQVRHFNRVLAEQLRELEAELAGRERAFVDSYDIALAQRPNPGKVGQYLKQQVQVALAAEQALVHDRRLTTQGDTATLKRFLKQLGAQFRAEDRLAAMGLF